MGAETLVFLHVLAAAALLGALLAVAALAAGSAATARLAYRWSLVTAAAALVTVVLGEAVRARQDAAGAWLDVASVLGYAGLLVPSIALVVVLRRTRSDPRWRMRAAGLSWSMVVVGLASTFVMAAKPF